MHVPIILYTCGLYLFGWLLPEALLYPVVFIAFAFTQLLGLAIAVWILFKHPSLTLYAAWHLQLFIYGCFSGALTTSYAYWFTLGVMFCTLKMETNDNTRLH